MIYLITYDLSEKDGDYNDLYEKIKSLGEYVHPLESTWFIKSDKDVNAIFDVLKSDMEGRGRIFIVDITDQERQGWMPKMAWDWLKK